jgi:hypothetical protein
MGACGLWAGENKMDRPEHEKRARRWFDWADAIGPIAGKTALKVFGGGMSWDSFVHHGDYVLFAIGAACIAGGLVWDWLGFGRDS